MGSQRSGSHPKRKECEKKKERGKEHAQQEEATHNKAAARFVEENRAQQKVTMAKEEASMPCRKSQGMS